jgi:oligosaccharide repeat unit polymerase
MAASRDERSPNLSGSTVVRINTRLRTMNYLLIISMIFIGCGPMIVELARSRFDIFNLKNTFILYYVLQLGISGIFTFVGGAPASFSIDPAQHPDKYIKALLLANVGLIFFQIGYYLTSRRPLAIPRLMKFEWISGRTEILVFSWFLLGYTAFFLLITTNGGFTVFLADREAFRAGGMVGQGFLIFPATAILALAAMIYLVKSLNRRCGNNRPSWMQFLVLALAVTPAYFLGFRSLLLLPVLQFMVTWNYGYRRISTLPLLGSGIVILIAFTAYGIGRAIPSGVSLNLETVGIAVAENPEIAYTLISRSKGTEVFATVIENLDRTSNYQFGWRSIVESLTILIPRSIWPDKPDAMSQQFTTYFFGDALALSRGYQMDAWGGISPTAAAEFYWHFGSAGICIGMLFLGSLARRIYSTLIYHRKNKAVLILYSLIFVTFSMFAEAMQGYVNTLVMHIPIIIASLMILTIPMYSNKRGRVNSTVATTGRGERAKSSVSKSVSQVEPGSWQR